MMPRVLILLLSKGRQKMKNSTLYPFNSANIQMSLATIIPPIYIITVEGETGSLDATINLVDTKQNENGYIVVNVEGKNGVAIGSTKYKRTINIQKTEDSKGVIIKGENKVETLEWEFFTKLAASESVGLFHLALQSTSRLIGSPTVNLQLGIDTAHETVSGIATVHQSIEQGTVATADVKGNFIYEYVMNPADSKIRINLTGYPHIHWPAGGGIGPVIMPNFKAIILLDTTWSSGTIEYQYATSNGWVKESQKIIHQSAEAFYAQTDSQKLSAVS